jgi:hypothetical protein
MSPEMPGGTRMETEEVLRQRFAKVEGIIMLLDCILAPGF